MENISSTPDADAQIVQTVYFTAIKELFDANLLDMEEPYHRQQKPKLSEKSQESHGKLDASETDREIDNIRDILEATHMLARHVRSLNCIRARTSKRKVDRITQ
jgi:hypothetical protein